MVKGDALLSDNGFMWTYEHVNVWTRSRASNNDLAWTALSRPAGPQYPAPRAGWVC